MLVPQTGGARLLTVEAAAEYLGRTEQALLISHKKLQTVRLSVVFSANTFQGARQMSAKTSAITRGSSEAAASAHAKLNSLR